MCATYRDKERRSNFESFANKIFTGIKEIKPEYAEKRAIWELFQNALDAIENNGCIKIEKTTLGLKFTHNGKPFRDEHIGGLIKQFSNGKSYGANDTYVGQYGTGFISTHVYGKKVIINGSILLDNGVKKKLSNFELDRTADELNNLTIAILSQDDFIADLCDGVGELDSDNSLETSFEYVASPRNHESIDSMLNYIHGIIPYIFCFNIKLKSVAITSDNKTINYTEPNFNNGLFSLKKDTAAISFSFLEDIKENLKIVLPHAELKDIPKLFLFYPLMETSDIGVNFLIHAQEFKPNRERDFLHLKPINPEVEKDVILNKHLLQRSFDIILNRIEEDNTIDFLGVIDILFIEDETEYEQELKEKYVNRVQILKRLIINEKPFAINDISFFGEELLQFDLVVLKSYYSVFVQFYDLMAFEQFIYISKLVTNWNEKGVKDLQLINIKEFYEIIFTNCEGYLDNIDQIEDYKAIVKSISWNVELLDEIPIIPNIHNELKKHGRLVKWSEPEMPLINVMNAINADVSSTYLHADFYFLTNIKEYSNENYKEDLSKFCNSLNEQLARKEYNPDKYDLKFIALTKWLNYFIGLNHITQLNLDLHAFFTRNLNLEFSRDSIAKAVSDFNYQPPFKLLSRLYILSIDNPKL